MEAKGMHGFGKLLTYRLAVRSYHILQALGKQNSRNHADGRTTLIVQVLGLRSITYRMDSRTDWGIGRKDIDWQNISASITTATKERKSKVTERPDMQADLKKKEHSNGKSNLFAAHHDRTQVLRTRTGKQKSSEQPNSLELQTQLLTAARPPGLQKSQNSSSPSPRSRHACSQAGRFSRTAGRDSRGPRWYRL
jgi:hypothetical protein